MIEPIITNKNVRRQRAMRLWKEWYDLHYFGDLLSYKEIAKKYKHGNKNYGASYIGWAIGEVRKVVVETNH